MALAAQLRGARDVACEQQQHGAQSLGESGAIGVRREARFRTDEAEPCKRRLALIANRQEQPCRRVGAAGERQCSGHVALAHQGEHLFQVRAQVEGVGAVFAPPQATVGAVEHDPARAREERANDLRVGSRVKSLRRQIPPSWQGIMTKPFCGRLAARDRDADHEMPVRSVRAPEVTAWRETPACAALPRRTLRHPRRAKYAPAARPGSRPALRGRGSCPAES